MADAYRALIPHNRSRRAQEDLEAALDRHAPQLTVLRTRRPAATLDQLSRVDILLAMHIEEEWYDRLEEVAWVQALTAGVNHFDLERLAEADVVLTNASGVHAIPIAEQVLGYMLMFERNLLKAVHQQHRGVWERFRGSELADRRVGVVGVGSIGSAVAERCHDLGMTVVGTKRDPTAPVPGVEAVYGPDELDEILVDTDYLVLACPLTPETRGLLDTDAIKVLPDDAVVINIARGEVVNQDHLVRALQRGHLRGAALDVFEEEPLPSDSVLWDLSNVIITPHMAGSTPNYWDRCAEIVADNLEAFDGGNLDGMRNRVL